MHGKHIIEVLTPKQSSEHFERELDAFAERYQRVLDEGYVASVLDNPLGIPRFQVTEVIGDLGLAAVKDQVLLHMNTFHTKADVDAILNRARDMDLTNLLVVTGDGGGRLAKLQAQDLKVAAKTVTSVELLQYIHREYPGVFRTGVAFNCYEPPADEMEKLRRKVKAGAKFVITQPVLKKDDNVLALRKLKLPVHVGAWMSTNLGLLSECVGYAILEDEVRDPMENLAMLRKTYPDFGVYLAQLGFKTQLPALKGVL